MATIDYKEKYEQALERARQFSEKPYLEDSAGIVEYIFPELKESEDEKIRKEMIFYFQKEIPLCSIQEHADKMKEFVAWIEKQGEQKPAYSKEMIEDIKNKEYAKGFDDGYNNAKQPQQDWSEEDESHIRYLIECLENCKKGVLLKMTVPTAQEYINWLKSLRPQSHWKNCTCHYDGRMQGL